LGQSGKGQHMVAACKEKEVFLGGSLIVANHLAEFTSNVKLVTALGYDCGYRSFIHQNINTNVEADFCKSSEMQTLIKKRYVLKDGESLVKLFETYTSNQNILDKKGVKNFQQKIIEQAKDVDLVLVCDFGNGLLIPEIMQTLTKLPNFLCLNTQINSGNRGFNAVTQYERADYISLNEPEIRLAVHDRFSDIEKITKKLQEKLPFQFLSITRGVNGAFCVDRKNQKKTEIPALNIHAIDRVGAGDSFFAISSLAAKMKLPIELVGLLGSIAAALDVQIVGNKEPVKKTHFLKYLTRLMK